MKQYLTLGLAMILSIALYAQKNTTRFMGISVDGTKSAMIQKLKTKGFSYNAKKDELIGQFNGQKVKLHIATNNNKVFRIMVVEYVGTSEADIKIRFNNLCNQFEKNGKYISFDDNFHIDKDENIQYNMTLLNKRYEANYYQISKAERDTTGFAKWTEENLIDLYDFFYNALPTDIREKELSKEEADAIIEEFHAYLLKNYFFKKVSHKPVWFTICEELGNYYILLYYDNELNKANGEDL